MSGPWERYAQAPVSRPDPVQRPGPGTGPWKRYQQLQPKPEMTAPTQVAAPEPEKPLSWSDVPGKAIENAPASALKFGEALVQPILHPIDTGKAIFDVGYGLASKLHGAVGGTQDPEKKAKDEAAANAVGEHFKSRYGSMEGFKKALAEDPVGVIADVSVVLTGGGAALSRGPGVVAKVGEVASKTGNAIDPLVNAGRAVSATGTAAANVLGMTTGAGTRPLVDAYAAGQQGSAAFKNNIRDRVPQEVAVALAESAVSKMGQKRSAEYTANMASTKASTRFVDPRPVYKAVDEGRRMATYNGVPISQAAVDVVEKLNKITLDFGLALGPSGKPTYTAEMFDAMKRAVGEVRQSTQQGSLERKIADKVYREIGSQIRTQVPEYAKAMSDYETASDLINEARRALSVNDRATIDTTLRKLQSSKRDGVNANFGQRAKLVDELSQYEPDLSPALSGQNLSAWAPRGLARLSSPTAVATLGSQMNPLSIPMAAMSSPRLMGELTYGAGRGAGMVEQAANALGLTPQMLLNMARAGYVSNALSPRDPAQN